MIIHKTIWQYGLGPNLKIKNWSRSVRHLVAPVTDSLTLSHWKRSSHIYAFWTTNKRTFGSIVPLISPEFRIVRVGQNARLLLLVIPRNHVMSRPVFENRNNARYVHMYEIRSINYYWECLVKNIYLKKKYFDFQTHTIQNVFTYLELPLNG